MLKVILIAIATLTTLALLLWLARKWLNWNAQKIPCAHFDDHVHAAIPNRFIREIQRDSGIDYETHGRDVLGETLKGLVERCALKSSGLVPEPDDPALSSRDKVLMLSGGGQWGAYGAGLFHHLHQRSPDRLAMTNVRVVTGVSTGSLQTLLLMVALDPHAKPETRDYAIDRLRWGYSPTKESEVVDNRGMLQVPLRGAQAGTRPLRKRIRNAIYENGDATIIEAIRDSSIEGFIGFVEARCGLFHCVDVRGLARGAASNEEAVDALTAAAMASSAMPVFHQQLRVTGCAGGDRTLYDGGVRRSVFFERALEQMREAVCDKAGAPGDTNPSPTEQAAVTPAFFVVRNGPTIRNEDRELDRKDGPIANGKRGYDLLVNESEIGAIASLRLLNHYGDIWLTTADGWDSFDCQCPDGDCAKKDEMFKPGFMACLRDLGRYKVERDGGAWWPMSPIG